LNKIGPEWLKVIGGFAAFLLGLSQYVRAQRWKRAEFVAAQIKEFEDNVKVNAALMMLDWSDRKIAFPSDELGKVVMIMVNEETLCSALLPHEVVSSFSRKEAAIRDCFDRLLDGYVRLQNFIESRLVSTKEVEPYLEYWTKLMAGKMKDRHAPHFYTLLHQYIAHYHFLGARRLIKSLGHCATPSDFALKEALATALAQRPAIHSTENEGTTTPD